MPFGIMTLRDRISLLKADLFRKGCNFTRPLTYTV